MGSTKEITFLLGAACCLIVVCKHITHTNATPDQLHEERREFQSIQRSSKIIGSGITSGYYNSQSGQYEQTVNDELDEWAKMHRNQVEGMAEKLRSQYNAALSSDKTGDHSNGATSGNNRYYKASSSYVSSSSNTAGSTTPIKNCNICAVLPSFTGKTQEELDIIAKNMTDQIISDMESGKLARTQISQPNWFENRVTQKLEELNKERQTVGTVYPPKIYGFNEAAGQQQQQSQQQNLYNRGGYYQGQTQSQHSVYYAPTSSQRSRYFNGQTSESQYPVMASPAGPLHRATENIEHRQRNEEQTRSTNYPAPPLLVGSNSVRTENVENRQRSEEHTRSTIYPKPVLVASNTLRTENNCTTTTSNHHTVAGGQSVGVPTLQRNEYQFPEDIDEGQQRIEDFGQQHEDFGQVQTNIDRNEYDYVRNQIAAATTPIPQHRYDDSYYSQHNTFETDRRVEQRLPPTPVQSLPTSPSIRSQTINRTKIETIDRTYVPIVVVPSQQTVIATSTLNVTEIEHRQPAIVYQPIVTSTNTYRRQEEEMAERIRNRTQVVRPVQPAYVNVPQTTVDRRSQEEEMAERIRNRTHVVRPVQPAYVNVQQTVDRRSEERRVEIQTPAPTIVTGSKHSIYGYLDESSEYVLPNYRPRVVIDKNVEFHSLDQRNEAERTRQEIHSQTNVNVNKEQTWTHARPTPPVFIQTDTDSREHDIQRQQTAFNQISTSSNQTQSTFNTEQNSTRHQTYIPPRPTYTEITRTHYAETNNRDATPTVVHFDRPYTDRTTYTETTTNHKSVEPLAPIHITTIQELSKYSREEYRHRLRRIQDELARLGYDRLTDREYNETIASGGFVHNGCQYVYNTDRQAYQKGKRVDITEAEYVAIYQRLRNQLQENRFGNMNELEVNQTITTGVFLRGGYKWMYDTETGRFDRIQIETNERQQIFARIQEILLRLELRQLTQRECQLVLYDGSLQRGGYRWLYNYINGMLVKSEYVGELSELSAAEYESIYRRIQETLTSLGYAQMSERECNATIASGSFEVGGIKWVYNADSALFERKTLSQEEYRQRLDVLRRQLLQLGYKQLSGDEYRDIIYRGYFYNGSSRYQFDASSGQYVRLELTAEEYRDRVRKLQEQLQRIGYGSMSAAECNATIANGLFHYGGYEWLYNGQLETYVQGGRSTIDEPGLNDKFDGANIRDQTEYGTTADRTDNVNGSAGGRRTQTIISKNRGDQPPQHFEDDYESEENVEQEPGIGFYPTGDKRPEIQLAPHDIFNQVRVVNKPQSMPDRPQAAIVPLEPYRNEEERRRYEMQSTHRVEAPPSAVYEPSRADYERRYQRTQSTYTRMTDAQPILYATQQSPTLTGQSNQDADDSNIHPELSRAHPTTAYRVGVEGETGHRQSDRRWAGRVSDSLLNHERTQQADTASASNVQVAKNASYAMGGSWSQSKDFNRDMETSGTPEEVQRRLSEFSVQNDDAQLMDFNGQQQEDVGQQFMDFGQHTMNEGLTQQRMDLTDWQQRDDTQQNVDHTVTRQDSIDEKAEVIEMTPPVEKPSFWQRMKDKTKNLIG